MWLDRREARGKLNAMSSMQIPPARSGQREGQGRTQEFRQGKSAEDLVYRRIAHRPELLIFAPRDRAFHVHLIWTAISSAKTWGDFIDMLPQGEMNRIKRSLDHELCRQSRFSGESLPGYSDGDYPPWLQAEIGRCIPSITIEEFGLKQSSAINGPFWEIPTEIEQPLVDRIRQLGLSVELRDDWQFF